MKWHLLIDQLTVGAEMAYTSLKWNVDTCKLGTLRTGRRLWTRDIDDYPWGEFWMYDEAAYQDMIYGTGYTGTLGINETTGKVAWHYADPAIPFETPYTSDGTSTYSVQNIRVIGGLVYVANSEHTPSQPATRGWGIDVSRRNNWRTTMEAFWYSNECRSSSRRILNSSKQL